MENKKQLLNVRELSAVLNVPISWIYQRTYQGQQAIPHLKIGKYVRFDLDEVMAFLKNNNVTGSEVTHG